MLISHSYNLRALRIILSVLCLCSKNGTTKPGWWHICLQHGVLKSLSPLLRPVAQSLSHAWLFVNPWTTACQASPSFTVSQREAYCWDLPLRKIDRGLVANRLLCSWDFSGKNAGVGCHFLLQGIFPTRRSNPSLLPCKQILYQLSHQGSGGE